MQMELTWADTSCIISALERQLAFLRTMVVEYDPRIVRTLRILSTLKGGE